ncbi:MAG: hypothetical protein RR394_05385 [Oscillospiraceae bacterium]
MIYQPTNILPSTFGGEGAGTVDAASGLIISWQINGASAMTAYSITIYKNDAASTQAYTTGKVTLTEPVFGTDYMGNVVYFAAAEISAATLSTAGIVNGYENGYKYLITQYWSDTGSVAQSQAAFFITRAAPRLTLAATSNPLTARTATFTASFSQAEHDTLNWFHWYIAETAAPDKYLFDSGDISGTENIKCVYDGFFTGVEYMVRCIIQTQNGESCDTGWQPFLCSYTVFPMEGLISALHPKGKNYVELSWSRISFILGSATGAYTTSNNILQLPAGSSVKWDTVTGRAMSFALPWSIAWRGFMPPSGGTAWSVLGGTDTLEFFCDGVNAKLKLGGNIIFTSPIRGSTGDFWNVLVTPTKVYIRQEASIGGLYPAVGLTPSRALVPSGNDTKVVNIYSGDVSYQQFPITSVKILGEQNCDFFWIFEGNASESVIDGFINSNGLTPSFDSGTYFLTNFSGGLNAGSLQAYSDNLIGISIYRRDGAENSLQHLIDLPLSAPGLRDYGVGSKQGAQYYLYPLGEKSFISQPMVSAAIKPIFWDYVILLCNEDEKGAFHVLKEYRFSCNVETGSISNNNAPSFLQNFTPYPSRQPCGSNYKSGTLTAYIGKIDYTENTYSDSISLAEELYSLSVSTAPKFLKDRKGNILRIETNAAISMQAGDVYFQQPYTCTIPWSEIAEARDAAIIATSSDTIWTN